MASYKTLSGCLLACALTLCGEAARAAEGPKGNLFIIGGGERTDQVMARFVELAGGRNARIVVMPQASGEPLDTAQGQTKHFKRLGAATADWIIFPKGGADAGTDLAKLKSATGVFFSGGDQERLISLLAGTRMLEEIRRIYREGGVVGGTSAGAAVMSKVMFTGEDRLAAKEDPFTAIRSSSVGTSDGFGFVAPNVVVDQHFLVRKRQNRLLSVVLEHPELTGIGIDEATAFIVGPDGKAEVLGESLVSVFDASGAAPITTDAKGHLAARGIILHLLKSGDKYDLNKRGMETK